MASRGPPFDQAHTMPLNMGAMGAALPDVQSTIPTVPVGQSHQQHQVYPNVPATPYQPQHIPQYTAQGSTNWSAGPMYSSPRSQQHQSYQSYAHGHAAMIVPHGYGLNTMPPSQNRVGVPGAPPQPYGHPSWVSQPMPPQFYVYPPSYGSQGQPPQNFSDAPFAYHAAQSRRLSLPVGQPPHRPNLVHTGVPGPPIASPSLAGGTVPLAHSSSAGSLLRPGSVPAAISRQSSETGKATPSMPRGPPRKPKQSGHALWVGNLPPGTAVTDLKDHFARDATQDIESVFLISKSNCAFVNYRTDAACAAAMSRFHDSRFQGVRLVCRLRRSTNTSPARDQADASPDTASSTDQPHPSQEEHTSPKDSQENLHESDAVKSNQTFIAESKSNAPRAAEKFFIVKSLTVQDLELSVRNGIWTTQAHNEDALNKAYESADNVYLIFSANKSGEYFGYARMVSPISEDASAALEWVPKVEVPIEEQDLPKAIPTPATEFAPKGRVVDDSARGTIFWEADNEDEEENNETGNENEEHHDDADEQEESSYADQAWGRPFKIEWISTNRLPFYRTRGLRNPWNANREVKIARDGTELETMVGRRLVQMFHRYLSTSQAPNYFVGHNFPMPTGYPHMPHY